MSEVQSFDRTSPPGFDTAVWSLRTLRPASVRENAGAETPTILADVQQAVRAMTESDLRRVASTEAGLAFQPRFLLRLLVYCYATGTFSSADIEDLMRNDTNFGHLCQGEFPSSRLLKRFRRENRTAIRDCVCAVLRHQSQRLGQPIGGAAQGRWEDALMEEADGRLLKAMFIDSMEHEND